jgi:hypothetical protein
MLRRQEAKAAVAARHAIVDGACSSVEMAIQKLEESGTLVMTDDQKAEIAVDLLTVMCNTGM